MGNCRCIYDNNRALMFRCDCCKRNKIPDAHFELINPPEKVKKQLIEGRAAISEAKDEGRKETLREVLPVLEFYGEDKNWRPREPNGFVYEVIEFDDMELNIFGTDDHCGGKRARALLEKIKKELGDG